MGHAVARCCCCEAAPPETLAAIVRPLDCAECCAETSLPSEPVRITTHHQVPPSQPLTPKSKKKGSGQGLPKSPKKGKGNALDYFAEEAPEAGQIEKRKTNFDTANDVQNYTVTSSISARSVVTSDSARNDSSRSPPAESARSARGVRATTYNDDGDEVHEDPGSFEAKVEMYVNAEIAKGDADGALMIACHGGVVELINYALEHDGVATGHDDAGVTAGYFAAQSGSLSALRGLLKHDVHRYYNALWFDSDFSIDNMTTLMSTLLHGHERIYHMLLYEHGCRLRLLGPDYGVDVAEYPGGLLAPLDKWMSFLPEISHVSQIPKLRSVVMQGKQINLGKDPKQYTEEEQDLARIARLRARRFVREILKFDAEREIRIVSGRGKPSADEKQSVRNAAEAMPSAGGGGQRRAVTLADLQALADNLPGNLKTARTARSARGGKYKEEDESHAIMKLLKQRSQQEPLERLVSRDINAPDDDGDGELWENEGAEFMSEKTVHQYFPRFKGSILALLGQHKLRELLRVVRFKSWKQGDHIFKEKGKIDKLVLLEEGQVIVRTTGIDRDTITNREGEPMKMLDTSSFLGRQEVPTHMVAIQVVSDSADCFYFMAEDVVTYCGFDSISQLVSCALTRAVMNACQMFKRSLSFQEQTAVSEILQFKEFNNKDVIAQKGSRLSDLILVQTGQLAVSDDRMKRRLIISNNRVETPEGVSYQRCFMVGLRSVLYDAGYSAQVEVEGGNCQTWVLNKEMCDARMPAGFNMRGLLQTCFFTDVMRSVPIFHKLRDADPRMRDFVKVLQGDDIWENDYVCEQGQEVKFMHVLIDGNVQRKVVGKKGQDLNADADFRRIHVLNLLDHLEQVPAQSSIIVTSPASVFLPMNLSLIESYFGPIEQLMAEHGSTLNDFLNQERRREAGVATKSLADDNVDVHVVNTVSWKKGDSIKKGKLYKAMEDLTYHGKMKKEIERIKTDEEKAEKAKNGEGRGSVLISGIRRFARRGLGS